MTRSIVWTSRFKRDYKLAMKRKLNMDLVDDCIRILARGEELPPHMKDHALAGTWVGHRECHISPDWLLLYKLMDNNLILVLSRTGSHSDLFE